MGGIVNKVTDAVGLTNTKGEKRAAAAAAENAAAANAMSAEQIQLAKDQLQFTKEQYQDWKDIYGDIQENLGNYYKSLTGDKLVTLGLEKQQQEYQAVERAIARDFAQRGLSNSGQETTASTVAKVQNATARATIRASSNDMAAEKKLQFLGVGLGQGTQLLGVVGNSAANVTNAFATGINSRTNIANSYLNRSNQINAANQAAISDVISSGAYVYGKK